MKTHAIYRSQAHFNTYLPYPNAATRRQILEKIVDRLLIGAIGVGSVTIILFLLTMV